MKKLALAAMLALAPAAADAAVILSFTGTSDAGVAVSGSITLDTAALPSNAATVPGNTDYQSTRSFLTVAFAGLSLPLGGGTGDNAAYGDRAPFGAGGGYTLTSETGSGTARQVTASFQLYTLNPTPSAMFDGALLPDLRTVGDIFYSFDRSGAAPFSSQGTISTVRYTISSAVPDVATWATMAAGMGLMGTMLRRRRPAAFA